MRIHFLRQISTITLCSFLIAGFSFAQERGKALYDLMGEGNLTKTEGVRSVTWLPGGKGYLHKQQENGRTEYFSVDPKTEKETPLFSSAIMQTLGKQFLAINGFDADAPLFEDFEFVLGGDAITFEKEGKYFLFNLKDQKLRQLKRKKVEKQPFSDGLMRRMATSQLWNGEYSPNFNHFAFVKDYDLYLTNTETGDEVRVTTDGNEQVFNGRPNWVYPEEFGQLTAYWWSPDGQKLAYYKYLEGDVHKYPLVYDLKPEAGLEMQSYPKAGETNPTVNLFVYDLQSGEHVQVKTQSHPNNYIIKPTWRNDGSELLFQRMNRRQNKLELVAASPASGRTRVIFEESEDAFINTHNDFYQFADGKSFLWSNEQSGWRHLYIFDWQGKEVRQITEGPWAVRSVTHVDEKGGWIYFTSHSEDGLETHFNRVRLDGKKLTRLTKEPGSHFVSMDPAGKYYTDMFSSFTAPTTMNLHAANGQKIRNMLSTNTEALDELGLEEPELVMVKAADGKTDLHGMLFKPAGYDPGQQYPLVVSVYGGPHSKMLRNSFQKDRFEQRLAQLGFMVWKMDNRGLTSRGKTFETETYLKLGDVDLEDQAAGVEFITQRPYIDGSRVGVYGHSYGGYMTSIALLKKPELFHVGVAGAPVTDWRNYDTIYTERYMRTPQENTAGYDTGSALKFAKNLQGKLLLIHGSIDNNVHPGNTIQLIEELVKAEKQFDLMFYPQQRHGIRGAGGRHYRQLRTDYFIKHLNPNPVKQQPKTD